MFFKTYKHHVIKATSTENRNSVTRKVPSRHTTLKQRRLYVESMLNRRCFNVVCLLGKAIQIKTTQTIRFSFTFRFYGLWQTSSQGMNVHLSFRWKGITKTCLFKYAKNFTTKNENFQIKNLIFSYFRSKHSGYSFEPPRWGDSKEYQNLCFWAEITKNNIYPCEPQFYYIKMGFKGSKLYRQVFVMVRWSVCYLPQ